jgi:hypothetical protein
MSLRARAWISRFIRAAAHGAVLSALLNLADLQPLDAAGAIEQGPAHKTEAKADSVGALVDWDALLRQTETEALTFPSTSKGGPEELSERTKSMERLWSEAERKRLAGAPDADAAIAFIDAAGKWLLAGRPHFLTEKLRNDSLKLSKNDPSYPVLCFFAGEVCRAARRSDDAQKCFDAAYAGSVKEEGSEFLTLIVASRRSNLAHKEWLNWTEYDAEFLAAAKRYHDSAAVAPEDERFVMERFCSEGFIDAAANCADQLRPIYENSKMPKWMVQTLAGSMEVKIAWKFRGSGSAPSVTEEGWEGFSKHLALARTALSEAWKLRPDMPFAASQMITVAVAVEEGETMRLWFDRAVAAQYDYDGAYNSMLWGLLPRWGGTYARMLAFGVACARTGRFDTAVPAYLNTAARQIANELPDWRPLLRQPELRKLLMETRRRCIEQATTAEARTYHTSMLLVEGAAVENDASTVEALQLFGGDSRSIRLDAEAKRFVRELQFDWWSGVQLARIRNGPHGAEFIAAINLLNSGKFAEAKSALEAILAGDREMAGNLTIAHTIRRAEFQIAFENGEWSPLPVTSRYAWHQLDGGGEWGENLKRLKFKRADLTRLLFKGDLGDRFEVRGKFKADLAGKWHGGFGVAFGHQPFGTGEFVQGWYIVGVHSVEAQPAAHLRTTTGDNQLMTLSLPANAESTFYFQRDKNRISFAIGDTKILDRHEFPDHLPAGEGAFGFGFIGSTLNTGTEVWDCEARKILD